MEAGGSLLQSKQHATCPYPKADQSNTYFRIHIRENPFKYYPRL